MVEFLKMGWNMQQNALADDNIWKVKYPWFTHNSPLITNIAYTGWTIMLI